MFVAGSNVGSHTHPAGVGSPTVTMDPSGIVSVGPHATAWFAVSRWTNMVPQLPATVQPLAVAIDGVSVAVPQLPVTVMVCAPAAVPSAV